MKIPKISEVRWIIGVPSEIPGRFLSVAVVTGSSEVVLTCDRDTDELLVSRRRRARKRGAQVLLQSGRYRVAWIWTLTNQQGYQDGIRFALSDEDRWLHFEFIAEASAIAAYEGKVLGNAVSRRP